MGCSAELLASRHGRRTERRCKRHAADGIARHSEGAPRVAAGNRDAVLGRGVGWQLSIFFGGGAEGAPPLGQWRSQTVIDRPAAADGDRL
jgi:hypothetical protein